MRQRKPKDLAKKLHELSQYIVEKPENQKGKWQEIFETQGEIYLEIGCGKGRFITERAKAYPEKRYIAIEGQESVLLRALEKIKENELNNIYVIKGYITDIRDFFQEGELSGIFLNFSDPWPKDRHSKRRLTHKSFLEGYKTVLDREGTVEFKTDNEGLYEFTLQELQGSSYEILEASRNLHDSNFSAKEIQTEYEMKFASKGKNINYVKWR